MQRRVWEVSVLALISTALCAPAHAEEALHARLVPLRPLLGKTWRGEFVGAEKPTVDVQRWERALNGQAIRILHSINDGEYGGESILFWDESRGSLVYYYFTTAGFHTNGTMTVEEDGVVAHELVKGAADGTTEVRSTSRLLEDGRLHTKAEYLKNGVWVAGHEARYEVDPSAEVVFR